MKYLVLSFFLVSAIIHGFSQQGIYDETDIEYQSLFMEAEIAKVMGDSETQVEKLKEVIKRNKESDAAYYQLSKYYYKEKNYEQAEKNANKAVVLAAGNQWYQLNLAQIYETSYQYGKAADAYGQIVKSKPDNYVAYHRLAFNQLSNRQPEKSVATLQILQDRQGITEETSRQIFEIYNRSGEVEKAITALRTLSAEFPDNTRLMNNLANYLRDSKKNDEAQAMFKKVLEIDPDDGHANMALLKNKSSNNSSSSFLTDLLPIIKNTEIPLDNKIMELMPHLSTISKDGESSAALDKISLILLDLYPTDAKALAIRGDVLFYTNDFAGAEKIYAEAINIDDSKFSLWDQWLMSMWEQGKTKELVDHSEDAMDLFPNQINPLIYSIIGLGQSGNKKLANKLISEAKLIAGKKSILLKSIELSDLWVNQEKIKTADLSVLDEESNFSPLYLDLLRDVSNLASSKDMAKKYWLKAIEMGANQDRINKKLGV